MKRLPVLTGLLAVLGLVLPPGVVFGQVPPGVTTVSNKRFAATAVPGPVELAQAVIDFPPGAGVPTHSHGGQAFITILEGALTLSGDGGEQTYRAGETVVEQPGEFLAASNAADGNTRLFVTYVLPQGARLTTVQEGAATPAVGPTTVAQGTFRIPTPPAAFEVVQLLLDFPPGAWTPPHSHGGPTLVTVLDGEVTELRAGGERRFGPGEGWTENAGDLHAAGNNGAAKASVAATILLRTGAELTTVRETLTPAAAPAPAAPALAPAPGPAPVQLPRIR
jgi:quercetin dioxygenase-like cupin family protein